MVSKSFLQKQIKAFEIEMEEKSSDDLRKPNYVLAIRSDNVVIGGIQSFAAAKNSTSTGSISKSKSKAKNKTISEKDVTNPSLEIQFIDRPQLFRRLKHSLNEISDTLVELLVEHLIKYLNGFTIQNILY